MTRRTIYIIDVTNRDGVQTSRLGLAKLEKTIINLYLDEMGIFQSEFGFPTTKHETNYLNANLELVEIGALKRIRLGGWMRAIKADVEEGFRLVPKLKHVNLSISTSDQMIKGKFRGKYTWEDIITMMCEAVEAAREYGAESIGVNAEDSSRTELERLIEFSEAAKEAGADRIRYCDTLGYDDPFTIYERVKRLAEEVRIPIELHCHNDLGMAVACSVAGAKGAIDGGVDAYITTTVNGMGERAGNADLVSTILAIRKSSGFKDKYHLDEHIDLRYAWKICKYASLSFRVPIPVNQPAVGDNAFAHESGIHADGALKDSNNYELYHYTEVGRGHIEQIETGRLITTGEYSGIKGFKNVAGKYELEFQDDREAREILELVRYANVHTQKPVTEDEMRFIARYPEQARKIMSVQP
ncbi:MAG TPA: homocitrate synthase [Candidatus Syntrophoarchaeum butanivorans]|uniref:Homocitrate synthase n=1 Tax=Candidatus Syntropharchaeum butanivorans TaxID=1839936 RepID=A0A1F2P4C4_9EURY|nr:MAG: trans-homoaconitate synthase [Candidatus Syntrophoarchaeum butanivorans]HEC56750.1 homocitrate synthase [Candidatus Syntrophoarchaeum butanivorans]